MRLRPLSTLLLGFALPTLCAAQGWDGASLAKGWARQDITGAFIFRDGNLLRTWTRDGSQSGALDVSKVEGAPELWVVDSWDKAWVVSGSTLTAVDKTGKVIRKDALPGQVADLAWDADCFYLSYRTDTYYVEKRTFKTGELVWSSGTKPKKGDSPAPRLYRIAVTNLGQVVLTMGAELNFILLSASTGRGTDQTNLSLANGPVPALQALSPERQAVLWWEAGAKVLAALPASQLPAATKGSLTGLVLAKADLAKGTLELLPTGLEEGAQLVGALDAEVSFSKPGGGLVVLQLK
ncbi:MAG TPA: hypothetical protein VJ570_10190 [Holophagaceae bacterium]|nr:hypothetical protein [Holophagaceae bacterium]